MINQNQQLFSSFNPTNNRVDTLYSETMGSSDEYGDLWEFVKMFLILFHGQSEDERGLRVNNQLLVENLKTKSWVALRRIEDHMYFLELSPENVKISNESIRSVKEAHRRYQDELEKQRKIKQESQKSLKRKIVANEINTFKGKRVKLISEIEMLRVVPDLLAIKAEKLHDFRYLTQSNQPKKLVDEKQKEVTELQKMEENFSKNF